MRLAAFGNEVAKTCRKQGPGHLREGEEQQGSASESINCPDSGPSEYKVDETEAHRRKQRLSVVSTGLFEDCARVKGDDVDCVTLVLEPCE